MMHRVLGALEAPVLIAVPIALIAAGYFQLGQNALLTMMVAAAAVMVFFANFEVSRPTLRQIMPTVVLAALAAAGRVLFAAIPDFKPVSAICIMAGALFGRRNGFMVGALAALVSNFFFGQGPWTPWQMYSWGLIGYLAGVLADRGLFEKTPILYVYGFTSSLFFGIVMNAYHVVSFVHPITLPAVVAACSASIGFDVIHAFATVLFLAMLYAPWRRKLERIKRKFDLGERSVLPSHDSL